MIIEITTAPGENEIDAKARRAIIEFVAETLGGKVDFIATDAISDWNGKGFDQYAKVLHSYMPSHMAKDVAAKAQARIQAD